MFETYILTQLTETSAPYTTDHHNRARKGHINYNAIWHNGVISASEIRFEINLLLYPEIPNAKDT